MSFVTEALAMAPQGAAAGQPSGSDMLLQFLPLILMFVIFWFLLIRPQQKRQKAHKQMLSELKKGDWIMTSAGFIGRILEISDTEVVLECGTAQLRMSRAAVAGVTGKDGKSLDASASASDKK